jgi:hypothetical protein
MRVSVVVLNDDGRTYGGEASLQVLETKPDAIDAYDHRADGMMVDFGLPLRPFMRRYGADKSGPKRFVLLLAHMVQGKSATAVEVSELQKQWSTMEGLIGGPFNSAYPTRAKDQGWVDATKPGIYVLLPDWTRIL